MGPLMEGDEGLPEPFVVERVLFSGAGSRGLDSKEGDGDVIVGD